MGIFLGAINTAVSFLILMLADRHDKIGDVSVTMCVFLVSIISYVVGTQHKRRRY